MTNNDLRFQAFLDANAKTLTIKDNNTWTGYNQAILIKVVISSIGLTIYENDGFDTGDFSLPDIVTGYSDSYSIPLEVDANGNIICGDYVVYIKANEAASILQTTAAEYDSTASVIEIDLSNESSPSTVSNAIINGGVLNVSSTGSGSNEGVYKIIESSFANDILTLTIDGEFASDETGDTLTIDYNNSVSVFSTNNTFKFCYTKPEIGISITSDCATSILISSDTTDYNANNGGSMYLPTNIDRVHSIQSPIGSGYTVPQPSSSQVITLLPNIWTGFWQSQIVSEVEYSVKKWSNTDQSYWFFIQDIIEGKSDAHEVKCLYCMCEMQACFQKFYNDYKRALSTNPTDAAWYAENLLKLNTLRLLFEDAEKCGTNYDAICKEIATILTDNDCKCDLITNEVSKEVIPISEVFGAGSGSKIYFSSSAPQPSFGNDNDTVFVTPAMSIYYKENGSWSNKGSLKGDTGDSGSQWLKGTSAPSSGLGRNGDFYLRSNGDVYSKVNGEWATTFSIKGEQGAAGVNGTNGEDGSLVFIQDSLPSTTNPENSIYINKKSKHIKQLVGGEWVGKGSFDTMTATKFDSLVAKPILKTQNRSTRDAYSSGNAIYITAIDTVNKVMTLNYIPNELRSIPYNEGGNYYEWTIWGYKTSSNNHNYYRRADIVDIDFANKTVTYGTTHYDGGDSTWDFAVNMNVMFVNPFANKYFIRKNFLIYKTQEVEHPVNGTKKAYTSFPIGMTKKNGVYRFWTLNNEFTRFRPSYLGASKLNGWVAVYEGADESEPTNLSPSLVLDYSDFEDALGTSIQPSDSNNFSMNFVRNVDSETLEFFFESKVGLGTSGSLIYLYEVNHDGEISNIRSYPITYPTYYSGSYITGCQYINGEYYFDYLDLVTGGASNWKIREFKLVGDSVFGYSVIHTGRDFPYVKPTDTSGHPGVSYSASFKHCNYKGLDLFAFQMRNEGNYNHMGTIVNGLAYYDYSDKTFKDISSNNIWHFATEIEAQTASGADTHGVPVKIYDTDLGYDHLGMPCMFYDEEEDILFFMGSETNGTDDYAPFVSRVRFKDE